MGAPEVTSHAERPGDLASPEGQNENQRGMYQNNESVVTSCPSCPRTVLILALKGL